MGDGCQQAAAEVPQNKTGANVCSWKFSAAESEGLQIPCAAAGVLAAVCIHLYNF